MARINLDECFWIDITDLAVALGCRFQATGQAVEFFRLAQSKYTKGLHISEAEFKKRGFSEKLFPVFATRTNDGIQATDSIKYFGWLRSKTEAGRSGGKKSAEIRKNRYGTAQPLSKTDILSLQSPKQNRSKTKHPEPSSSTSYINTTTTEEQKNTKVKKQPIICPNNTHPVEDFENGFSPEIEKIAHYLTSTLGPNYFKPSYMGKVVTRFKSAEDFRLWLVDLTNSESTRFPDGSIIKRKVLMAILKEIGVR